MTKPETDKNKFSHHAHIAFGVQPEEILSFIEQTGVIVSGNPDVRRIVADIFTIDHARELTLTQENKPLSGEVNVFVIETNVITVEAQNALLKVFEEPSGHSHFFLVMPQDTLLPTLRSRLMEMDDGSKEKNLKSEPGKENILDLDLGKRLSAVKKMVDEIKDEDATKQDAIEIVNAIETELYGEGVVKNAAKLRLCREAKDALLDNGAPVKMILENLVISV